MTRKEQVILEYLALQPMTVDEFLLRGPGVYVNAWAPVFTGLKKKGLIVATDEKRLTRWGKLARVHVITTGGQQALAAA